MPGVVAIDIGTVNFALAWIKDNGEVGFMDICDLTGKGANGSFRNLITYLRSLDWIFINHKPDIIIEKQMQSKHRTNIKALKMSQHVLAFFLNCHPGLTVREFASTQKSRFIGQGLTYSGRKKAAVVETIRWLETDPVSLDWFMSLSKKDDVADCILMCRCWLDDREARCSA